MVSTIGTNRVKSSKAFENMIVKIPKNKTPIIIAGGSFNSKGRVTVIKEELRQQLKEIMEKIDNKKMYFVIGHKLQGYERAVLDISNEIGKKFDVIAIVPKYVSEEIRENIYNSRELTGVYICPDSSELGIYKSFNYEVFERIPSIVIAFDGNTPATNLIQEAKNGKEKSKIFVNENVEILKEKAISLEGYVKLFNNNLVELVLK